MNSQDLLSAEDTFSFSPDDQPSVGSSMEVSALSINYFVRENKLTYDLTQMFGSATPTPGAIFIPDIPTSAFSESWCLVCHSSQKRRVVPTAAVNQAWNIKKIFIHKSARVCPEHLENNLFKEEILNGLVPTQLGVYMTPEEMSRWMRSSTKGEFMLQPRLDFSSGSITEEDLEYLIPGGNKLLGSKYLS